MATDPNDPTAPAVAPLVDPATGQPIAPTATMTFAEWCALDAALKDADAAAFTAHYGAGATARIEAREAAEAAADAAAGSAFAMFYGAGAEQKMDRETLDLRIAAMTQQLEATPPAPPA